VPARPDHWNQVFASKGEQDVSWYEAIPTVSLDMIDAAGATASTCIVDIGGGHSRLIDQLIARGMTCLAVLDVSSAALARAQTRLGADASKVSWINADVTGEWRLKPMDIWHDRAAFHFLTDADDRARYAGHLSATVKSGGSAIIATFALDGPPSCSGLPVMRYSPESLSAELGPAFQLAQTVTHAHRTPWGVVQQFQYSRFTRRI
jgi:hypothetical protein